MARVIAITSGKIGVGKSILSASLALALSDHAEKICLLDAADGIADIDAPSGMRPEVTFADYLKGQKRLDEVILRFRENLHIVPAASCIAECAGLDAEQRRRLILGLAELDCRYDYLLIDTAVGTEKGVPDVLLAAGTAILVITPDPASLTDAFTLIRILKNRETGIDFHVLVNMAKDRAVSLEVFDRFQSAIKNYLDLNVDYLGYVPLDEALLNGANSLSAVSPAYPSSPARWAVKHIAEVVREQLPAIGETSNFSRYWGGSEFDLTGQMPEPPPMDTAEEPEHPPNTESGPASAESDARPPAPAEETVTSGIAVDTDRVSTSPFDTIRMLRRELEAKEFSENDINEICRTLEAIYQSRGEAPAENADDAIVHLPPDVCESDEKSRELLERLRSGYQLRFQRRLIDPMAELERWISEADFAEDDFRHLQEKAAEWFRHRFGKPYQDDKNRLFKELRAEINTLAEREATLQATAEGLMLALRTVRNSTKRLDELLQSR